MTENYNNYEREFSWDDTIQEDQKEFITLKPGTYYYTVESFERQRHTPSDNNPNPNKLPACNKAVLKLKIDTRDGSAYATHNLFLHSRTEGMLSAFFGSIGQKKHDQPLQMNWNTVPGSIGVARFKNREYRGNLFNEVDRMIYKEDINPSEILNHKPVNDSQAPAPQFNPVPDQTIQPQPTNNFRPGQF